jgi:hypothetical protein
MAFNRKSVFKENCFAAFLRYLAQAYAIQWPTIIGKTAGQAAQIKESLIID